MFAYGAEIPWRELVRVDHVKGDLNMNLCSVVLRILNYIFTSQSPYEQYCM
jgi:hypothetical protein